MTVMARRPPETAVLPAPLVLPPEAAAEDGVVEAELTGVEPVGVVEAELDAAVPFVEPNNVVGNMRGEFVFMLMEPSSLRTSGFWAMKLRT